VAEQRLTPQEQIDSEAASPDGTDRATVDATGEPRGARTGGEQYPAEERHW
jgi:hypothetical protein